MEKLITESLAYARKHFSAFGLEDSQVELLLVAGERDLRKELSHLKALVETAPLDANSVEHSLHALKGLLLNMGNAEAGQAFKGLEEDFKRSRAIAGIMAVLEAE